MFGFLRKESSNKLQVMGHKVEVVSIKDWYAIQHNDSEDEDAAERKADQVNSGRAKITDVIAVTEQSPHL